METVISYFLYSTGWVGNIICILRYIEMYKCNEILALYQGVKDYKCFIFFEYIMISMCVEFIFHKYARLLILMKISAIIHQVKFNIYHNCFSKNEIEIRIICKILYVNRETKNI